VTTQASLRAQIADLLGEDPYASPEADERPTVREALRSCGRGQVVPARHRGRDVALFVLDDGRAFVTPDQCPHGAARLSDGYVDGDKLVCGRHNWEFDACSGSCAGRSAAIVTRLIGRR
jgi:naphthalene 1,2-dioxygenase system ferredoxin subunit